MNQDPLGKQGVRIRGNATECQVWLRHLDNGNELYVVLFNNGQGSCAPSAPAPARFAGPFKRAYSDNDCPNIGNHPGKTVAQCEELCVTTPGCDAFNYGSGCSLRSCGDTHLGNPTWDDPRVVSYRTSSSVRDDQLCVACHSALRCTTGPQQDAHCVCSDCCCSLKSQAPAANATMGFTWKEVGVSPECMMSTTELITGAYWGTIQGQLSVSLRPQASAAFRMHPHCDVPAPPPPF